MGCGGGCVLPRRWHGGGERQHGSDQIEGRDRVRRHRRAETMLQKDGERVIVEVPRASVASVNGQPLPPPVAAGFKAPDFTATDLAGATHSLAQNRGQVTLLKFWATWCPHCRADVSYMKELFTKYHGKPLRLVTVSVDQDLEALKAFLGKEQVPYPVVTSLRHPELAGRYEVQGIPAYRLIDANGVVVKTWGGSLTEGDADGKTELETFLTTLLP